MTRPLAPARASTARSRAARSPVSPSRTSPAPTRVGIDTGGTFTDFVALVRGRLVAFKRPSTPREPDRAPAEGLAFLGASSTTRVRYGSTLATNTLLERRGARVVLITTAGFEDLIEIGRQDRPDLYAIAPRRVEPLVPADRRIGVAERLGPGGVVWRPLTRAGIARAVRAARRARPEAIAVGLLHAYADPRHERRLVRALRAVGVPVSASAELCREFREYERLATTVTNAYVLPRVATHLRRLSAATPARLTVVLSHGGTASGEEAAREPVRQLLSGPAAGLVAARGVARACGFDRALTLDVGGTSTDCAYLEGPLPRRRGREVGGFPVQLPLLDVHTIGAGGGSIARVDAGGLLRVGPESAGADPGPAAYGGGGPATLTDALLVLGRLPVTRLAGGAVTLDPAAAERALRPVARALATLRRGSVGRPTVRAAEGVVAVAESAMAAALRRVSVERGHDPRSAALVAFGGAGGLHACACAEAIGCRSVIFPRHAGVLSAIGALQAGERREASRTVLLDARDASAAARILDDLERRCARGFAAADRARVRWERWVEARYRGQSHELALPWTRDLEARFHRAHERRFGFADPAGVVEVVTLEVRGALADERVPHGRAAWSDPATTPPRVTAMAMHAGRRVRATLHAHPARHGWRGRGPAFVLQDGATLWIPPGWRAKTGGGGAVIVERSA